MSREEGSSHRVIPIYLDDVKAQVPFGLQVLQCISVSPSRDLSKIGTDLLQLLRDQPGLFCALNSGGLCRLLAQAIYLPVTNRADFLQHQMVKGIF